MWRQVVSRSPSAASAGGAVKEYLDSWGAAHRLLRQGRSWSGHERNCVFLNRRGDRFANVSAASGLDFADDGRGLAVVDWDCDGDLDLWLGNRTGPRLRLMRNGTDAAGGRSFLAIRLRGTQSNRDGIGGRVTVRFKGATQPPLIQTVRAGDGFLSQSSKWLHFGLGQRPEIDSVVVHWPSGKTESFGLLRPSRHYVLVEGAGTAKEWQRPGDGPIDLSPSEQTPPETQQHRRVLLYSGFPMPVLKYRPFGASGVEEIEARSKPLLLNFWASWCVPCVSELAEVAARQEELRASGLEVLALSVDGLGVDKSPQPADAKALLKKIDFGFDSGLATTELLDKIELVQEVLFDRRASFAVPLSLLLDRDGRLRVIYRGRLRLEELLDDVKNLEVPTPVWIERSQRFSGRWHGRNALAVHLEAAAARFRESYPEDATRYLKLQLERQEQWVAAKVESAANIEQARIHYNMGEVLRSQGELEGAIEEFRRALELYPDFPQAHNDLAVALSSTGHPDEALPHFERALALDPDAANAHYNLGKNMELLGKRDGAMRHYREALKLSPDFPEAINSVGKLLVAERRIKEAENHFWKALLLKPDLAEAYYNLGMLSVMRKNWQDAVEHFRKAIQFRPDFADAHNSLGIAFSSQGNFAEAAKHFRKFVAMEPQLASAHNNLGRALAAQGELGESLDHFRKAVDLKPNYATARKNLGETLRRMGRLDEALEHLRKALELRSDWPDAMRGVAWILATHPDSSARDGEEAVRLAERAAQLAKPPTVDLLDTLGAAYAAVGRFDRATAVTEQALQLAISSKSPAVEQIRSRLELYRQGKPFRDKAAED